jgi:hypothetical protein
VDDDISRKGGDAGGGILFYLRGKIRKVKRKPA